VFGELPLLLIVSEQPRYKLCGDLLHVPSYALKFAGMYDERDLTCQHSQQWYFVGVT
jgi:hypothetical protein